MQVTIEDISSIKKTLHVEIPREEVAREIDKAYGEIKKSAKIKGFRPGKVPRSVLEKMFKKDVLADVSSRLIQSSFVDAIKEKDLKVVGRPKLTPPALDASQPYRYAATVEVTPPIADLDIKGLNLKRSTYQVSEAEINAQLKMLQRNLARLQKIAENRPVREGDHVLIDFQGFKDEKPFAGAPKTENFTLKVGSGPVHQEFDQQLIGMTAGETRKFPLSFPTDYSNPDLAGQSLQFSVTLSEIREEILPEIDDEFAQRAGRFKTLEELKQGIAANLTQGYAKRVEQELSEQIFSGLLQRTDFEVPESLVEMELEGIIEEAERSFSHRNIKLQDVGLSREGIAEKYRDTALKQVKRHLLMGKIIEQEKLDLNDNELDEALQKMAESFNQPLAEIRRYYREHPEKLDYFKQALLEKKAVKLILDGSDIEDVAPETHNAPGKKET
jgi:trigger factor